MPTNAKEYAQPALSGHTVSDWLAIAFVGLIWFVMRIRKHPSPIVDPALFRVPSFVWANVTVLLFCTAFGALFLSVAVWLQTAAGFNLIEAGLAMVPGPVAVPLAAYLVQKFAPNASPRSLIISGNLVFGVGAVLLAVMASAPADYLSEVLPGWVIIGVGIGMALPTMIATATRDVPAQMAATGSGVVNTSRQLGYVFGVAFLVTVTGSFALPPEQARSAFQLGWLSIAFLVVLSATAAFRLRSQKQASSP